MVIPLTEFSSHRPFDNRAPPPNEILGGHNHTFAGDGPARRAVDPVPTGTIRSGANTAAANMAEAGSCRLLTFYIARALMSVSVCHP